ncbi:MAG: histidinol-phosphate transaminase [Idiomarina sp.]|nr:histidinol-phosphate transaminase [Idiomarina sp.]
MNIAKQLLRPHLRDMTPYASARRSMSGGKIWLNANESPYSAEYQVITEHLNRYPNFQSEPLNRAYADYAGVPITSVMSHRGSDESIELLIRAFCEPGRDAILICPPTYGMYSISATLNNNATIRVPLLRSDKPADDWQLDLNGIRAALDDVKVVFLCNPSNPLGNQLRADDIRAVLEMTRERAIVVVDEAYIEYAQTESATRFMADYPHLVVTRTLSKAFGLAGIRVGFTLAHPDVVQALVPVLAPYPLPDVSIQIATQALSLDSRIQVNQNVIEAIGERERLVEFLATQRWVTRLYPSATNFILCEVRSATTVMQHCQDAGILLRNQSSQLGLEECVRITVGSPAENDELIRVLTLLEEQVS